VFEAASSLRPEDTEDAERLTIHRGGSLRGRYISRLLNERRIRSVLPWIGMLLVYAFSSITTDSVGSAPTRRDWVFGRLFGEHTFGQTFVLERDELVAVRVLLFANPTDREDPLTLRLRYADSALPDLAVATLPLRALSRGGMTTFAIPPLTLSFPPRVVTTTLRLDLEAPTLTPLNWITVIAGPDTYPAGELFQDKIARPSADLAFQPVYRRRWFDLALPISRMAYGKPGLLGWPPFYALLAYACCVMLARLLLRLWRALRVAACHVK
jgi:hypothetical protein